ncbi:MAG: hypothetical protein GWP19_11840 [Planctomycetia bacterium]|nr:hypothetical protein [Planctomycetia bacterium]
MNQFIQSTNVLLPLLYGLVLGIYTWYFLQSTRSVGVIASRLFFAIILLHIIFLVSQGVHYRIFPIATVFSSMSMLALDLSLIYYVIEKRTKESRTGIFFLGIIFGFQLLSSMFISYGEPTSSLLRNPMFGIHTTFTILGISALAIAALYSLMYLMLAKKIKGHRFGLIYDGLPALETLENMARYATSVGVILLGAGILLGHFWAYKVLGYFFKLDVKIIVTDVAWLFYAIGWFYVKFRGLHGLRMSQISVWGFILFFVTLVLGNIIASTFHQFI